MLLSAARARHRPIVVMTQKNHALDEMLTRVMDADASVKVVRIGGGSKKPCIADCNLFKIMQSIREAKKLRVTHELHQEKLLGHTELLAAKEALQSHLAELADCSAGSTDWVKIVLSQATTEQVGAMRLHWQHQIWCRMASAGNMQSLLV